MPALKIQGVDDKGDLDAECVWLSVDEDIENLAYYILSDTTYTDDNHISNELRHIFWFPKKSVTAGDWIRLMTKNGKQTSEMNEHGTKTHTFHWKLGRTVWNKDEDAAILFTLKTWKAMRV